MALRASQRHFFRRIAARNTSAYPAAATQLPSMSRTAIALEPEAPYWLGGAVEVTPHVTEALATGGAVSPFLALDYAPSRKREGPRRSYGVDTHPVRGFEVVTLCLEGEARDAGGPIKEGDVRWLTAGQGALVEGLGSPARALMDPALYRLRVNVPRDLKMSPPRLQRFEARDASVVALGDCTMRVYAGDVCGVLGPVEPEVDGTQLYVVDGAGNVELPLDGEATALVLVIRGTCTVGGVVFGANRAFYAPPGEACMTVELAASTKLVVALALPTTDPVVVGGPFVMTSATEIARAYEDFLHGRFNATGGRPEAYASDSDSSAVE